VRAALVSLRGAVLETLANPVALWSQSTIMVVNNAVWVGFWFAFFEQTTDLRGWDLNGVLQLWAVLTAVAGIALGLLANCRAIARLVVDGGLDAVLTLPVPPLAWILARRVEATNLGDGLFGLVLFALTGPLTPGRIAVFAFVVACGTAVLTGFLVVVESLVFFTGDGEFGRLAFNAIVTLSSYPTDIFSGVVRLLLYTLVPAAFVSAVPARLLTRFDPGLAALLLAAAVLAAVAGWATFTLGLRRYTSGSAWTRA